MTDLRDSQIGWATWLPTLEEMLKKTTTGLSHADRVFAYNEWKRGQSPRQVADALGDINEMLAAQ